MSPKVDKFLSALDRWQEEASQLREILLGAKLDEDLKWGKPCYGSDGHNVAIIQPFKACLGMMFFKGALLKDPKGVLVDNGPNSQSAKRLEFRSVQDVVKMKATIKAYLKEAVALEKSGAKVELKKKPERAPAELLAAFKRKPALAKAFKALTPGRQRAYILHFAGAKQAATRASRIEKCTPRILAGKGFNEA
jgi:uncharacterized protein YdeI (YjbR/CyaY-like superfamily)